MNNKQASFEKNGVLIFAITMFASGLNYLFQILSGRLLSTADYGELNAVFSTINILVVFGSALGLSITKHIAETESNDGGSIKQILKHLLYIILPFIAVSSTIIFFVTNVNFYTSVITSITVYTMVIAFVFFSVMQGKKMFTNVGFYNLIQPVVKFIGGILLLVIGMRYQSVLYIMIAGALLSALYGYIKSKKIINYKTNGNNNEIKNIYKFFVFTFISTVCLTIFNNIDILIVQRFFDETTTGMYSSAALFGKIILYIPTALITMMIPMVAESKTNKESLQALKKTFIYSIGLSGIACTGLYVLRHFIIKLLMGEKFLPATEYVLPVCAMMLSLVCATVFVNYLIAKGDKWFTTIVCIIGVIATIILISIFHSAISQIAYILSAIYLVLFVILLIRTIIITKK